MRGAWDVNKYFIFILKRLQASASPNLIAKRKSFLGTSPMLMCLISPKRPTMWPGNEVWKTFFPFGLFCLVSVFQTVSDKFMPHHVFGFEMPFDPARHGCERCTDGPVR